ncbi:B12-binding domain-containing radical SAM protein [Candidatus Omnitrophota bacterium]
MKRTLKIALGELRHRTIGRHSSLMPLGISLIAAFLKSQMNEVVDIRLYEDPEEFFNDVDCWKPDIVGLTNFMWNAELNRRAFEYVKEVIPSAVTIAGGPEFPVDLQLCEKYLQERKCIDFFIHLEGEVVFANLVKDFHERGNLEGLKNSKREGILSIHSKNSSLVFGGPAPRITDFLSFPSPYLMELMDKWFDGTYAPSIQTSRGCPNSCAYCRAGNNLYSRVIQFPIERVKEELSWIAKRMVKTPSLVLHIVDSNFGLFERDEEISDHIGELQDQYGWPNVILADTGKNFDRVLRMNEKVKKKMTVSCSFQSLNAETLKIINRKNIDIPDYVRIQKEINGKHIRTDVELIIPLPAETRESFMDAISFFYSSGVDNISPFTTMMLPGTLLDRKDIREKYGLQTRFRIIPRQFGEYLGKKCFETEEVCIATSSMDFDDYLACRGFAFLCMLFADRQYDIIANCIKELSVDKANFIFEFSKMISSESNEFTAIYNEFMRETKEELYESRKKLLERLNTPQCYEMLLKSEIGDNLVRKYRTKTLSEGFTAFVEMAYKTLHELIDESESVDVNACLKEVKRWMLAARNVAEVFFDENSLGKTIELSCQCDVAKWYLDGINAKPLTNYVSKVNYRLFYDNEKIKRILERAKKTYGQDREFCMGRTLLEYRADVFWRKTESVKT